MKKILSLSFLILFILACSKSDKKAWPETLGDKQTFLNEKRQELSAIQADIDSLLKQIELLDTTSASKRKVVTLMPLSRRDFKKYITIQGSVMTDDMVKVSSEIGGRLTHIYVKEGDFINKGKLIAKTDLESVQKQIAELNTGYDLAKTIFERQERLWKQNIGSEIQYLEAKNNKERIEKSLESLQYQSSRTNIYAPISGVVDSEFLQQGEMASPGQPIISLMNVDKVKVVADIPENHIGIVKKGDKITLSFPAIQDTIVAPISMIGRTIDPANRTFKIEINLDNRKSKLKPNLLTEILLNDHQVANAVVIPLSVIQEEVSGRNYVYIMESHESGAVARKVYVELGESYEGDVVINSGLSGSESIIIDGARGLTDGQKISIKNVAQ